MDAVSDRIGLVNGANRLYTMDGQLIKSLEELENDKVMINDNLSLFIRCSFILWFKFYQKSYSIL